MNVLKPLRRLIVEAVRRRGYDIVRVTHDDDAKRLFARVRPYTMTGLDRIEALCRAVKYVAHNNIPGDIVECGVYHGGSMMAAALTLLQFESTARTLYLFDTFDGMSLPTDLDVNLHGVCATDIYKSEKEITTVPLHLVQRAMKSTGYPENKLRYVVGKVEDTLPDAAPQKIALLRLDTDWYESTYHEMVHLFPRLSTGGVLIVDDYGHWSGAKRAVDQYIEENKVRILLCRIDYTGVIAIKSGD